MDSDGRFFKGDNVQLVHTDKVGKIIAVYKNYATIQFDYVKLTLPLEEIQHLPSSQLSIPRHTLPASNSTVGNNILDMHKFLSFHPEIDLHGLGVEEAIDTLEKWIDQGLLAEHRYLRIIHGKGKGILRQQVHQHLKSHGLVTKIIENHGFPGGSGVTCIEL